MSQLLDAAKQWENMLNTSYTITVGHKNSMKELNLRFEAVDFDHLSGIHYASDVDFKLPRAKYRGGKLLDAILSGRLDSTLIEKSRNWSSISQRLSCIISICTILDSDFSLYEFSAPKLPFYSKIEAKYLLYSEELEAGVFVFFDELGNTYYCKSIFTDNVHDYKRNQTPYTVLKKIKSHDGEETVLYTHPTFKAER